MMLWCLWVSGGRRDISRRHKMTISSWMIRNDVAQVTEGAQLPLVPARRRAGIAQGCVSHRAGTAMDAS